MRHGKRKRFFQLSGCHTTTLKMNCSECGSNMAIRNGIAKCKSCGNKELLDRIITIFKNLIKKH
jgi:ribosomal protein L37AE/L43A